MSTTTVNLTACDLARHHMASALSVLTTVLDADVLYGVLRSYRGAMLLRQIAIKTNDQETVDDASTLFAHVGIMLMHVGEHVINLPDDQWQRAVSEIYELMNQGVGTFDPDAIAQDAVAHVAGLYRERDGAANPPDKKDRPHLRLVSSTDKPE